jgi:hypothetical protein
MDQGPDQDYVMVPKRGLLAGLARRVEPSQGKLYLAAQWLTPTVA